MNAEFRTIIIESPFEGGTEREADNVAYAKRCMNDSLMRGEAPYLSHLLYPGTLDDTIPAQRARGIQAGHAIGARMQAWVFYLDRGVTRGMLEGIDAAVSAGFRPQHVSLDPLEICVPYERAILFRTFGEPGVGERYNEFALNYFADAGQIMLHDCGRWPELVARFTEWARRNWDLPR